MQQRDAVLLDYYGLNVVGAATRQYSEQTVDRPRLSNCTLSGSVHIVHFEEDESLYARAHSEFIRDEG